MRRLLPLLMFACSGNEPNPEAHVLGIWQVTAVNGQSLPVPTESGDTFLGGYLDLPIAPVAGMEYCATNQGNPAAHFYDLRWRLDGVRVIITYRNLPGAFQPIDTALIDSETMRWHVKAAEARLGASVWDLTRISTDPNADAPNACP